MFDQIAKFGRRRLILAIVIGLSVYVAEVGADITGVGSNGKTMADGDAGNALMAGKPDERPANEELARTDFARPFEEVFADSKTPLIIPYDAEQGAQIWASAPNPESPDDEDSTRFDFCMGANGFNLDNATWLAYFSANQYAHFAFLAKPLGAAGFGKSDVQAALWQLCGKDLYAIRTIEERDKKEYKPQKDVQWIDDVLNHRLPLGLGPPDLGGCMREWRREAFKEACDRDSCPRLAGTLSAELEKWLVAGTTRNAYIQFLSGSELNIPWRHDGQSGTMRFEAGSTQVFWARHGKKPLVVIAFRGTEVRAEQRWADIAADAKAWQIAHTINDQDWGEVHWGFKNAFLEVRDQLLHLLSGIEDAGQEIEIYVTGHSLGAALATHMAAHILQNVHDKPSRRYRLKGLYSYGSPRVGNDAFVQRFGELLTTQPHYPGSGRPANGLVARFRNGQDIVTGIPFRYVSHILKWVGLSGLAKLDYAHLSTLGHFQDGNFIFGDNPDIGTANSPEDHAMATKYYQAVMTARADPRYAAYRRCP